MRFVALTKLQSLRILQYTMRVQKNTELLKYGANQQTERGAATDST
jgi:hypothetical protein